MGFYFISTKMVTIESAQMTSVAVDVEKLEPLYTIRLSNATVAFQNQFGSSSKSKTELLYDPAIPLLGIQEN